MTIRIEILDLLYNYIIITKNSNEAERAFLLYANLDNKALVHNDIIKLFSSTKIKSYDLSELEYGSIRSNKTHDKRTIMSILLNGLFFFNELIDKDNSGLNGTEFYIKFK